MIATLAIVSLLASAAALAGEDADARAAQESRWSHAVLVDQLEMRAQNGPDAVHWEQGAWLGGDTHRAWLDTSGDLRTSERVGGVAELQLSVGRRFGGRGNVRAGVRHDRSWGPGEDLDRTFAVLDATVALPVGVDLAPALFLSEYGDVAARLTGLGDWALAERWIAQARFELNVAAHDVPDFGIESGANEVELGLRVRYQTPRGVAPYVGISWVRALGSTADLAAEAGNDRYALAGVVGIRFGF